MAVKKTQKIDFNKVAIDVLGTAVGGAGGKFATAKFLPAGMNPMIKSLIPIGLGVVAPMLVKNDFVSAVGSGLIAVGSAEILGALILPPVVAPAKTISGLASEYGISGPSDEMATYEETATMGNPDDAGNSLGQLSFPSPWGSNPSRATDQSLAGLDDDFNSIAGMDLDAPIDAGLSSEYGY